MVEQGLTKGSRAGKFVFVLYAWRGKGVWTLEAREVKDMQFAALLVYVGTWSLEAWRLQGFKASSFVRCFVPASLSELRSVRR
jgi:hypothetical protein